MPPPAPFTPQSPLTVAVAHGVFRIMVLAGAVWLGWTIGTAIRHVGVVAIDAGHARIEVLQ